MKNRKLRSAGAAFFVVILVCLLGAGVAATEPSVEETIPVQTTQNTEPEQPAPEATEVLAEPEATQPEPTEPATYTADTETELYKVCEEVAQEIEAAHILVYDTGSDKLIYSRTVEGGKLYPASITKLYSAYVALQYLDPDEVLTAGDEMSLVKEGSSVAYIAQGQQLRTKMVVEAMMLPSGNDAAMMLAASAGRRIAGDDSLPGEEAVNLFVKEMNRMAEELGFEKSHFSNPDGYHVGSHYTCVKDMVRIAKLALDNYTISRYMKVYKDDVTYISGQANHWENTNLLVNPEAVYYRSDAIGMKTGFTSQAKHSLMSAFRNGEDVIVVGVFGCPEGNDRFNGAIKLMLACKEQMRLEQEALERQLLEQQAEQQTEETEGTP